MAKPHQPIPYYGGKYLMLKHIIPLIPEHETYIEPFVGGGSVLWAKTPSKIEIINDKNAMISNFYGQLKNNFKNLKKLIDATPYSRDMHELAHTIYKSPFLFSKAEKAWAIFVCATQSYLSILDSTWKYGRDTHKYTLSYFNKKLKLTDYFAHRLEHVQIENKDAGYVIRTRDCVNAFHYIDPPYPNTSQGHYEGYTMNDFIKILNQLEGLKGKFMLSSYPYDELRKRSLENNWVQIEIEKTLSPSKRKGAKKTEVITMNYSI